MVRNVGLWPAKTFAWKTRVTQYLRNGGPLEMLSISKLIKIKLLLHQFSNLLFNLHFTVCAFVGVCSSNSLATWWGTRNLIYISAFILLWLLLTNLITFLLFSAFPYFSLPPSSSIVAVFIAKARHVWVSWPEEFLLYILSRILQQVCYC